MGVDSARHDVEPTGVDHLSRLDWLRGLEKPGDALALDGHVRLEDRIRRDDLAIPDQEIEHGWMRDRKSTRLNSSHSQISYAVFCLKKKKEPMQPVHILVISRPGVSPSFGI